MGIWSLDSLSAVELRNEIPVLIGGMKISFISSLVAILCSLIWTYFDKNLMNDTKKKIEKLNNKLHKVLPIRVESNLLDEIVDNQREQIKTTKEFVSDTLIPELVNGLQEAVDQSIAPSITNMNSNIESFVKESAASREEMVGGIESVVNDKIAPQITKMHDIMSDLAGFSMDKQAESIDKMVNKFLDTFNEAFDHQFESLKETLEEVIEWQKETKQETENLIEIVTQGAKQQNELLHSTEDVLSNIQAYIEEFEKVNQNLNQNVAKLSNTGSQLSALEEKTNDKLDILLDSNKSLKR
ncbi:hypothetical protein MWH25_09325 [Natroniella acetigena]|uniref:hypothetical protein n=1 Tax=Natroniella acetigena TaxID=52004 RepID=UPI00200A5AF0|nr:hypothetical protein [Natroniella acetigena]MCK8827938.1 hypothetical protein [Natroniella acetigena]